MTRRNKDNDAAAPSNALEGEAATIGNLELGAGVQAADAATDELEGSDVVLDGDEPVKTADDRLREARIEARLEELRLEQAAARVRAAEQDAVIANLTAQLGRKLEGKPAEIVVIAGSVNQDVFAQGWARRVPGRDPKDAPKIAKTYIVRPRGQSEKDGMPIATVKNCADASDAKCWYAKKLGIEGKSITCDVQLADPAAA
jgi:hypothetical protein